MFTQQLKEALSIQNSIQGSNIQGTQVTTPINMQKFHRAMFVVSVGVVGASGTVDAWLEESDYANASGASNLATTVKITQIATSNQIASLEIRANQMSKQYLRCKTVTGVANSIVSVLGLGAEGHYNPVYGNDDASVVQRVVA